MYIYTYIFAFSTYSVTIINIFSSSFRMLNVERPVTFFFLPSLQEHPTFDRQKMIWMVGSMASVTIVKFILMLYCRSFNNQIVRAYAQDHFFDVMTNSIGLASSLLAVKFYWWMDPVGAILVS